LLPTSVMLNFRGTVLQAPIKETKIMLYKTPHFHYFYVVLKHGPFQREEKILRIFDRRILRKNDILEEIEGI